MILFLLVLACHPASSGDEDDDGDGGLPQDSGDGGQGDGGQGDGGAGDGGTPVWPDPQVLASAPAIDPTLEGDPRIELQVTIPDQATDCGVEVELVHAEGPWLALAPGAISPGQEAVWTWDGRDLDGSPFPVGRVTAWLWTDCADGSRGAASLELAVLRLAPASIDLGAEGGPEIPLAFHKADLVHVDPQPIVGPEYRLSTWTDQAPVVPLWTDPDQAPWGDGAPDSVDRNVPAALVKGSTPRLVVVPVAEEAVEVDPSLTVVLQSPAAATWADGSVVALPALDDTVGVQTLALTWTWAACMGEGCTPVPLPGQRHTEHRVYRMLGQSQLRDGSADGYADGTPWIGVLADTADAVQGAPDAAAVMDGLRDRVSTDPWLIYDPSDSAYSDYDGAYMYWDSITSQLSDWLDRRQGLNLYCHSVSCLLSTLGQSWGADAEQIVLGVGFDTNLARAAGTETWGRWSFNSHSVATLDGGAHIWDASIDLDGDEEPDQQPVTPVSPKGMDGEEYLWRLTYDEIGIINRGKCFVE